MHSTKSVCPECKEVIEASIFENNDRVLMEKECPEHGKFEEVYWSDANLYRKFQKYRHEGNGVSNPLTSDDEGCPLSCGLCPSHKTTTLLANIDVTNRCNLNCPICFANAKTRGFIYEPTFQQIENMLKILREEKPTPCPAIQFSGGEPTVRDDLPAMIQKAKEMGFVQIQIATNGVRIAKDIEFARKLKNAGLHTIYLSFDGVKEETYQKIRNFNALPVKEKAIGNCREAGIHSIVLVPTLVKGENDDQLADIVRFATDKLDVVKGINFQPVAFTGRIDRQSREKQRFTIPDLIKGLADQTSGEVAENAWYPIPFVVPISRFIEGVQGKYLPEFTVHPHCGAATYLFVEEGRIIPITDFLDVEGFIELLDDATQDLNGTKARNLINLARVVREIPKLVDQEKAPKSINITKMLINIIKEGEREVTSQFHRKSLFVGAMHFQDLYNFDLERVCRCGIHYATPDGRIIPFCSYNAFHRDEVEGQFLKPYNLNTK
ncbi:tetraether lipid synthase Tes [Methanohalophilus halophilus]|uniref:Radical SAM protein n=1 Tax=Methanohalophilus halophilus TaxID=2177 RepID=A0A1L3Q1F1_9EURY|nr:radical SAM protein [Methanohalophilus halophilus]APH38706.1 radical SAM protein [Methanohalophilus halophilus]RNI08294.1 radical SAM protein [Methanohalophilus halophilus]SDX02242.1 hypothetical protein SAMN04515625_2088 [Methanohalophilus halophilus]